MLIALSLCLSVWGWAALALAMGRHHAALMRSGRRQVMLRAAGVLALAASLVCAVVSNGWPVGTLLWIGLMTLAALAVIGALAGWSARLSRHGPRHPHKR